MTARRKNISGFSLTEFAIVMAVIGVMIGGLWTIFGQTAESTNQHQLAQDITAVVSNVRAVYANRAFMSGTAQTIMFNPSGTQPVGLVTLRTVFPADMGVPGTKPSSPWGIASLGNGGAFSTFNVCAWNLGCASTTACACDLSAAAVSITSPVFAIDVENLSTASCIVAATRSSNSSMPSGLIDVYVNGTSVGLGAGALPVKVAAAEGANACGKTANANVVDFVYRLNAATAP